MTTTCAAPLRDGSSCQTHAEQGSDYCAHHRLFPPPPPPEPVAIEPEASMEPEETPEPATATATVKSKTPVADVRGQLARDVADEYDLLRASLLDALEAQRDVYATCPKCGKRHPLTVPDWTARTRAIQVLLEQGFGKPVSKPPEPTESDYFSMTLAELEAEEAALMRELEGLPVPPKGRGESRS